MVVGCIKYLISDILKERALSISLSPLFHMLAMFYLLALCLKFSGKGLVGHPVRRACTAGLPTPYLAGVPWECCFRESSYLQL